MLSRLRRYSTSSSWAIPTEAEHHGSPDGDNVQHSRRVRKLLEGVSRLEIPALTHKASTRSNVAAPRDSQKPKAGPKKESQATMRLFKLKRLPALSPTGCQFAIDAEEGKFTHGDIVGKGLSQWLHDDLPHSEEIAGEPRAARLKANVAIMRGKNMKEIRALVIAGAAFERAEHWSREETRRASTFPRAICTTGVRGVRTI